MVILFWFSVFMIMYAYMGYLATLWLFSGFVPRKEESPESTQSDRTPVTLIISAYNEENIIEKKIVNSLEMDYPKELLEIVVISDGSDDTTNQIVSNYARDNDNVILRYYEGRIGKTSCLNKAIPLAKGEIVVFSDANSFYNADTIRRLVEPFADPKIGFVTGHTKYAMGEDGSVLESIGIYSRLEKLTKRYESVVGSCVGGDGAIFAIRKELYEPLNSYDINDFVIPLKIVKKGYRGVLQESAYCVEGTAKGNSGEFKRQARITNRTIRAIINNIDILNPFKYGFYSVEVFSHKLVKYLVPFFLASLLISNVFLTGTGWFFNLALAGQVLFYFISSWKFSTANPKKLARIGEIARTFTTVNIAILVGWLQYLKGEKYTTWTTAR